MSEVLRGGELGRVGVVQPASWAVMVALAAVWRSYGVEPDAVVGHSQGEIAAAVVSGALSLEDGARVVALRSAAIARRLAGAGGMMSVALPAGEVAGRLDERLSIAAVNGPRSVVVSGVPAALDALRDELAAEDVRVRRVPVDYASHSHQVAELRDELLTELAPVRPRPADVPFWSTVTADRIDTTTMDADYWYRNLRQTVRFEPAVRGLLDTGHRAFIEVSPHPVLTFAVQETAEDAGGRVVVAGTLRRDDGGGDRLATSLAEVFVRGVTVDWALPAGRRVDLPTYPFQRESYWSPPAVLAQADRGEPTDDGAWAAIEQADPAVLAADLRVDQDALAAVLPALTAWRRDRDEEATVDSWRYRIRWTPVPAGPAPALAGTWLLVTPGDGDTEVEAVLGAHGAEVRRLVLTETDRAGVADRLREAGAAEAAGIVSLLAEAGDPTPGHPALPLGLARTVTLVQALGDAGIEAPLWCLTRGAVSTGRSDQVENPAQALVAGIGWTAALEHADRWGGTVDLPPVLDGRAGRRLAAALAGDTGEDQLAVRGSGLLARRLVPAPAAPPTGRWEPGGTTLVTGGTGTLAPHVARWLAEHGADHVVLASRRGPTAPGAEDLVAGLGVPAEVVACDVTDREALAALRDRLRDEGREVRTVIHAAAVIELSPLADTDLDGLTTVLDAKVTGARNLDEVFGEVDRFVLFSSVVGLWGAGQHAAYVAGNAYLHALAEHRRARGRAATSLHWGIWADDLELGRVDPGQIRRSGLEFMDPRRALAGLRAALDAHDPVVAVADVDWARYHPVYTAIRPTRLFDEVPAVRRLAESAEHAPDPATGGELAARLRSLPAQERERVLLDLVRAEAAAVLGHGSADALDERRAFRDAGFDSVTAVDLRNRIARGTGLALPATMVFDHPNPVALAGFLLAELNGAAPAPPAEVTAALVADDPIAVIGMSCRYPGGATSPERLWELVVDGVDAISGFPVDRGWSAEALYDPDPDRPGHTYSVQGGFLHDVADFDPAFFGVSPREALAMDPQQRLLLETAWEAFERAGLDPHTLRGSRTGTFVGASYQDYGSGVAGTVDNAEGHQVTGSLPSVLSGRIAYLFGLEGPALTLDTACSSSLVALHLAARSLAAGECGLALAGGVSVMATPAPFIGFSRQRALALDGRCKAYAEGADGMTLAEGVGLVLLERLSDARRNGHPVLAVLRGSAVNQDGASNGLTAPNGPAQQRVITDALAAAGLRPSDVDAVEGHGTGTALGDPIEAQALLATYGRDRSTPLLLGSVKSNLGHTQMASGIAGVIKMVQALRHGLLPRTLHVDTPSSHVDWSAGSVRLLTEAQEWPAADRPRRAGVSSFGLSGTNAHAILEQAPPAEVAPEPVAAPQPVLVSARDERALRARAADLLSIVDGSTSVTDLAAALATTRSAFEHRAAFVAADRDELVAGLTAVRDGEGQPGLVTGRAGRGRTAVLFGGQGSQRVGMGRELYERFGVFADALDEVLAHLDPELDRPLREVMWGEAPGLDETGFTQPAVFALEVALYRLVESWGVAPDYLAGHSVGELVAAHVAGVLTLADAAGLVAARARLMQALPPGGAMVAVRATEDEVESMINGHAGAVSIAALNGPSSLVIAGDEEPTLHLAARLADAGRRTRRLRVSHAFHSPRMDAMLAGFARAAAAVTYHPPTLPVVSTLSGALATAEELCSPDHWVTHVRNAVRFADGVSALAAQGVTTFLELGPDGSLSGMAAETLGDTAVSVPTLRRDRPEVPALLAGVAGLHTRGGAVNWPAFFADSGARHLDLPTYPFQRERYWPSTAAPAAPPAHDDELWAAVRRDDRDHLASTLGLDADTVAAVAPALARWRRRRDEQAGVDQLRYRVEWRPVTSAAPPPAGRWLVLVPPGLAPPAWLPDLLPGATVVEPGPDLAVPEDVAGVLSLLTLAGGRSALTLTAAAVQALADVGSTARLWCLTSGAVAVSATEAPDPDQAAVWGLGRVVALEHPDTWGGLVDVPATVDRHVVRRLAGLLGGEEDQVAVRAAGVLARRLVPAPVPADRPAREYRPAGTVLVTGATGGVGGQVARWLAREGAEHLLLASRGGPDAPRAGELVAELTDLGTRVTLAACDVGDRGALAALLDGVEVTAVFHAAGVVDDGVVDALTPARFETVMRAKADGARHLDELVGEVDAFVLFSSTAGVLGAAGQGNYAAANAYLDALAARRRALGRPATSVAWGPWAGDGMAAGTAVATAGASAAVPERLRRGGLTPLPPARAIAALRRAIEAGDTEVTVADVDWVRFAPALAALRPAPLLADLTGSADPAPVPGEPALADRLAALPEAQRERQVLDLLRAQVAVVLGHGDGSSVDADKPFRDLGFDSLTTVELRNALTAVTGLRLPASLVFDHPTPRELAAFLVGELVGRLPAPQAGEARAVTAEPVAVVGIGCRFPGGVTSPEQLWELLAQGRDGIVDFPDDRGWDLAALAGRSATAKGGFLAGVADFDADFFGISPREALAMDPQQRLLLETSWEALERAGLDPTALRGSDTGVFVGTNGQDYVDVLRRAAAALPDPSAGESLGGHVATGTTASVMSGRLAYTLGLEGPAVTVDTACSASLVALHLAARALRSGECSLALAGGVSVMSTPDSFVEFSLQGGLAADGRCKAFGDGADGTGWSEGVGVVVLERLSDARRNGHRVLAVVRGSAVNSDGASNGLTAPNGPAQQRVIRAALADAGLSTQDVDVVEAHGTGTTLGDPIEAQALLATYGQDREHPLLLGSVKSNLGHTQGAAGVAGVIKVVLALRHGRLPRTLHVDTPSSHVDWSAGSVALLAEDTAWPDTGRPRRAGVSAFGISGTNAHVIVEQAPEADPAPAGVEPAVVPWPVSARSEAALNAQLGRLAEFADRHPELSRAAVGRALATERAALPRRAVLLDGVEIARDVATAGELGVLFSGQGAQRVGMGRGLYERFDVFADAFDETLAHLDPGLREVVWGDEPGLAETGRTQPALFALEVALFRLVESWGLAPDHLAGHSVGELVAAHVAGVLSLPDACALVSARARLMQALPAGGAMVAVQAGEDEVTPLLDADVSLAAVNGPRSVVLAGAEHAVLAVAERFAAQGRRTRRLHVSHAFHSPLMDPVLDPLREVAAGLTYHPPRIPVVSTLTGALATAEQLCSPDHWVRHVREPVRFAAGLDTLLATGTRTFLELGPDGVLCAMAAESLASGAVAVPALRADRDEETSLVTALGRLHTRGVPVDWPAFFADTRPAAVDLPTYAFRRERFWPDLPAAPAPAADPADAEFWSAVDRADVDSLAATLDLNADAGALATVLPALSSWRRRRQERSVAERWCYRVDWQLVPVPVSAEPPGTWLAVVPPGWTGDEWLCAAVAALGGAVLPVEDGPDLATRLAEVGAGVSGVVSLLAAAASPAPTDTGSTAWPTTMLGVLADAGVAAPLWCLTRGAAADEPDPAQAAVWGAGRVCALESPDRWGGLVDLVEPAAGLGAVLSGIGEDQVAVRPDGVFARRLVRAAPDGTGWTPAGTVLVVGAGGMGEPLARWLAGAGAGRVVLAGAEPLAGLEVADCDTTDREALAALLASLPALTAVVVADPSPAGVAAAEHLDALTGDLEAFVLCTTVAGVWGVAGRGAEAAAGAHLEALALRRQRRGRPATSIAWGSWGADGPLAAHLRLTGLPPLDPDLALAVLTRVVGGGAPSTVVADVAWDRFAAAFTGARPSPLLTGVPEARVALDTARRDRRAAEGAADRLRERLAALPPAERHPVVLELVRERVAAVLGHVGAEAVEADRAFRELGFDSLTAVDLRNELSTATGLALPATLAFDHPTPAALAEHVLAELLPDASVSDEEADLRALLASVPLTRLREIGVLEPLLRLAGRDGTAAAPADRDVDAMDLDAMDVDDLVQAALNGQAHD
ncbi:hypothetical protein BU204_36395 [Actinophytocola xanthii]|uniref:6-deoxyerythronolide-B synthase n=1 Tax=Actinophytocola xanthii TaxID=1912961 RepID=A0A1Q8BWC4_9PSEU|nr:hypothetical protein BU204_36395 [Actinophytocola xanthii]